MGGFSGSVADLYAGLTLDSKSFTVDLAEATRQFIKSGEEIKAEALSVGELYTAVAARMGAAAVASATAQAWAGQSTRDVLLQLAIANRVFEGAATASAEAVALESASFAISADAIAGDIVSTGADTAVKNVNTQATLANAMAQQTRNAIVKASFIAGGYEGGRLASLVTTPGAGAITAGVGSALAVGFAVKELVSLTDQSAKAARETSNLAAELNITWQEARSLQEQAELAGTKVDVLKQAGSRLAASLEGIGTGSKAARDALKSIGVEGGIGSGDVLMQFLQKLSGISDDTERIALLRAALGRASYELVPIVQNLSTLRALLTDLGPVLDNNLVNKLTATEQQIALMEVEWKRFKQELALSAGPYIIKITREVTDVMKSGPGAVGQIGLAALEALTGHAGEAMGRLLALRTKLTEEQQKAVELEMRGAAQSKVNADARGKEWTDDIDKAKSAQQQYSKTLEGMTSDLKDYEAELKNLQTKRISIADVLVGDTARADVDKKIADTKAKISSLKDQIAEKDPTARFQRAEQTAQSEMKRADAVAAAQEAKVHKEQALQSREYTEKLSFIDAMDKLDATRLDKSLSVIASELYTEQNSIDRDRDIENHRYKVKSESLDKLEKAAQTDGKKGLSEQARVADQRFDLETSHAKKLEDLSTQEEAAFVSAKQRGAKEADKITLEQHRRDEEIAHSAEDLARRQSDDAVKAQQITLQSAADTSTKRLELLKTQATFEESQGTISMTRRLSIDRDIAQREYAIEKDSTEKQIVLLSERSAWDTTAASRAASLKEKSASLDAKYAAQQEGFRQREILGLTDSGIAMQKLIAEQNKLNQEGSAMEYTDLQLTLMKTGVDSLRVSYQGLSGVVDSTFKAGAQGFSRVGSSMAESLVTFKGFTAAWKSGLHSIEVEIVGTLINSLIKLGAAQVWLALTNHKTSISATVDYAAQTAAASTYYTTVVAAATAAKLATSIINVDEILGASAVGGANVAAWTAAIPFVGPAVAVEAGMAMANAIDAAFIPFAAFKQGGDIPTDMLAQLHGGEAVLSDDTNSMLRQSLRTGGSGGGSTLVFDFNGAVFHGVPSAQVINPFMNEVVRRLRVAKVIKT